MFSNFPTFRLEHAYYRVDQSSRSVIDTRYFSREYEARHRILVAFVELCRSTRQKFLPWLWEHVQSLCVHSPGLEGQKCRQLAKTVFRRQSRTLIATPSLAVFVKCVPVIFSRSVSLLNLNPRTFSVHILRPNAPGLVKLLPLLSNLDTLEVLTQDDDPSIERSFKPIRLPQILTLVIDAQAHYLMRCCTRVKRVVIHQRGFDVTFLDSIPSVADTLVYLALCLPVPEIIQSADVFFPSHRPNDPSNKARLGRLMSRSRGTWHRPGRSGLQICVTPCALAQT